MIKVDWNKDIFRSALATTDISQEKLNNKFPKWKKWLEGSDKPTLKQLEELSNLLHIPFGQFFLKNLPKEEIPIPFFRTIQHQEVQISPDLKEVIHDTIRKQEWIKEYYYRMEKEELSFVGSINENENPKIAAEKIRSTLGMEETWSSRWKNWEESLNALIDKIEELGIFVTITGVVKNNTHRILNVDECRGFVLVDKLAPFIFINGQDAKAAQMFTLAHELAHIWIGKSAGFDLREILPSKEPIEKLCDQVASEFLVPKEQFLRQWKDRKTKNKIHELAKFFKVSEIVIARKALDTHQINRNDFISFYNNYVQRVRKKSSGGNFYSMQIRKVGKKFAQTINNAVKDGSLLYRDAFQLTGLYGKTYDEFMKRIENIENERNNLPT